MNRLTTWLRSPLADRLTTGLVVLLSLSSLLYASVIGTRQVALSRCQVVYATGMADAIDARADAGKEPDAAQDALWMLFKRGLAETPSPELRAEFGAALDQYLAARERVKQAQATHPIKAPRDLCPDQ